MFKLQTSILQRQLPTKRVTLAPFYFCFKTFCSFPHCPRIANRKLGLYGRLHVSAGLFNDGADGGLNVSNK